jgi:hypothetical protein
MCVSLYARVMGDLKKAAQRLPMAISASEGLDCGEVTTISEATRPKAT